MNTPLLPCVEVQTAVSPVASVIWLHGLGADGHDFEPIVPALDLPPALPLRFVFPHAPVRPVALNAGMRMRAWFDIYGLTPDSRLDEQGIRESSAEIARLVARENEYGVPPQRVVLAGFSQGGAVALHTGLCAAQPPAAMMGLSTFLPLSESLTAEYRPDAGDMPVFMAHGKRDEVVPYQWGEKSMSYLKSMGYEVEWHTYTAGHGVGPEEIRDIRAWLMTVLLAG
ncbi:MAG: carboxylesterase [Pseudomonadota bacterium]|nr:carboxylesterase [Pseudomonadota bacterium]